MRAHPLIALAGILLIFLPIAYYSAFTLHSASQTAQESATSKLNAVEYSGGKCEQSVDGFAAACESNSDSSSPVTQGKQKELITNAVPDMDVELEYKVFTEAKFGDVTATIDIRQIKPVPGALLPEEGEIFLPRRVMQERSVSEGDVINVGGKELKIAGVTPSYDAIVREPTLIDPDEVKAEYTSEKVDGGEGFTSPVFEPNQGSIVWYLSGSRALEWEDVKKLNDVGFIVQSEDVRNNPPPADEVYENFRDVEPDEGNIPLHAIMDPFALALAILLFLFVLPVFAFSASRRARDYALMQSQGATRFHIWASVTAYGLITGFLGAVSGALIGLALGAAYWKARYPEWPIVFEWQSVAIAVLIAIVASVAAAAIPAFVSARMPISRGIAGAAPDKVLRFRPWFLIGPILAAVGLAFSTVTVMGSEAWYLSPLGMPITVVGIAASAPLIVYFLSKLKGSLSVRLAARELSRNALRSAPAIALLSAGVLFAVSISATVLSMSKTDADVASRTYDPSAVVINVYADSFDGHGGPDAAETNDPHVADEAAARVADITESTTRHDIYGLSSMEKVIDLKLDCDFPLYPGSAPYMREDFQNFDDSGEPAPLDPEKDPSVNPDAARECRPMSYTAPPESPFYGRTILANEDSLAAFKFESEEDKHKAHDALGRRAILAPKNLLPRERMTIESRKIDDSGSTHLVEKSIEDVEVVAVLPETEGGYLYTQAVFDEFGVEPTYEGTLLTGDKPVTYKEYTALIDYLEASGFTISVAPLAPTATDPPWASWSVAGLLLVCIAVITALLSLVSAKSTSRQYALLAAVGADPRLPRQVSAWVAALIAGTATLIGLATGTLLALAWSEPTMYDINGFVLTHGSREHSTLGIGPSLLLLIGAPIVAAAVGAVFHRQTDPAQYRET